MHKNKYEGIKYNLDEVYELIKLNKFSNVNMYDLDYDKLNETQIIVGQQSFGTRDMLTNQEGKSTQRFLKYSMDDGTELTVIIGELSTDIINKHTILMIW